MRDKAVSRVPFTAAVVMGKTTQQLDEHRGTAAAWRSLINLFANLTLAIKKWLLMLRTKWLGNTISTTRGAVDLLFMANYTETRYAVQQQLVGYTFRFGGRASYAFSLGT